ncbi:MAG: hypothetical protein HY042_05540 [Spirochaetia bacterium]|nr:hypothetical protein [Spirochaetia bacterium]
MQNRTFLVIIVKPIVSFFFCGVPLALVFRPMRRDGWSFFSALLIIACLCFSQGLQSQTQSAADSPQASGFELLLKRQTFTYTPYEYTSYTQRSSYVQIYEPVLTGPLRQNENVLVPAVLSYEDRMVPWRFEVSYYEIELPVLNTVVLRTAPGSAVLTRQYLNPVARSEALVTAARRMSVYPGWNFYAGGGVQNINKYVYGYNTLQGSPYQEYFFTYGLSGNARLTGQLTESLSVTVATKIFYTTGTRFAGNGSVAAESVTFPPGAALLISSGTAHTRGLFRGGEVDLSLSCRIFDRFRLHLGYDHNSSFFSYVHYHQMNVTFPASPAGTPAVSYAPKAGNYEIVRGVYAAMSVLF